ncbi:MAG: restriction endonuclease subunit S [Spirochaetia bacterium]|nr:restriction endonuclease subunit S [Spirochaetia bacterium]
MKANYRKLSEIVELIDERNTDGKVQNLIGVSIDKCFIKSVANTIGTDLSKYSVIHKNDFACSLMQVSRDGKIPIACLKEYDEAIMSPAYYIFRIKNTFEVLPDYLAMWFMRTEFDREASYVAVGGVRGSMPWEVFCDMKLAVPSITEQQKIINNYNTITRRIDILQKINEKLEKTAQCLFENIFKHELQKEEISFTDVIDLLGGGTPCTTENAYWNGNISFFAPADIDKSIYCFRTDKTLTEEGLNNCSSKLYPENTTFVTCRGTVGKLALAGKPMAMNQSCYALKDKKGQYPFFTYSFSKFAVSKLKNKASGAVFSALVTRDFEMEKVFKPNLEKMTEYETKASSIFENISSNEKEIFKLQELKQLVISQILKG